VPLTTLYPHLETIDQTESAMEIAKSLYPDLETYQFIQLQAQLFNQMLPELVSDYQDQYVYFENGQVLASDTDEERLLDFIEEKYGLKPMFIEKVSY